MARPCPDTMDLLTWEPREIVERFEENAVRAASLRTRIAKAVSETLRSSDLSRCETARRMSDWLGEEVSTLMPVRRGTRTPFHTSGSWPWCR